MQKIGKQLLILLLLSSTLLATVNTYVNAKYIQAGDVIKYTIETDSDDTIFPNIDSIGGYPILSSPQSSSVQIINGKKTVQKSKSYVFKPVKDIVIPEFNIQIGNQNYKTEKIEIKVSKRTQTLDKEYKFNISLDKYSPYVGEEIRLEAVFEIDASLKLEALDVNFDTLDELWIKSEDENWRGNRNGSKVIYKRIFYLYAQRPGEIEISNHPIVGQILEGGRSFFLSGVKNFSAYSNELKLNVKPLPKNASLVGEFSMSVKTDKFKTTSKDPINLSVEITGNGNIDDYEPPKIEIDGVTVYDDKPILETKRIENKLFTKAVYKYALVCENNFTIPSYSLTFVNPENDKIKTISSNAVNIEVENIVPHNISIQNVHTATASGKKSENSESTGSDSLIFLIIGIFIGLIIGYVVPKIKQKNNISNKKDTLAHNVQSANDQKELLRYVLGYIDDYDFQKIIAKLEKGATKNELKALKKSVIDLLKIKGIEQ